MALHAKRMVAVSTVTQLLQLFACLFGYFWFHWCACLLLSLRVEQQNFFWFSVLDLIDTNQHRISNTQQAIDLSVFYVLLSILKIALSLSLVLASRFSAVSSFPSKAVSPCGVGYFTHPATQQNITTQHKRNNKKKQK